MSELARAPAPLEAVLNLDGFVIFIDGPKGSGKTNLGMLLAELCQHFRYRKYFATNIKTECYFMEQITNLPDLESWLKTKHGKKVYVLDEAGKHIKKLRFMTEQNIKFMELIQLIRHYDCGFIGIAPSTRFVDSGFMDSDILDARITKLSLHNAKVDDRYNNERYFLNDLPKTSILHNSKDDALFSMKKEIQTLDMPRHYQIAHFYRLGSTFNKLSENFHITPEQAKRDLRKYIAETELLISQATKKVDEPIENPEAN